ncbi:MAG: 3'(2'),5'-bisphosphate nucleotidase CysQ [Candidatus Riflebacteria bacterium]|nr:3'(2'),5'-bisphosphate nucleotidase CysQ [Candidatus Riflebacteria bacterium]
MTKSKHAPGDGPDTTGPEPYGRELSLATALARAAGDVLLHYLRTGVPVEYKGIDDPVTRADREADALIVEGIASGFPADGILSEEIPDSGSRLGRSRVWFVDPMDGTKEFIKGSGEFSVLIGLIVDRRPRVGVVYQPSADLLYAGVVGSRAWVDERGRRSPLDLTVGDRSASGPTDDRAAASDDGTGTPRWTLAVSRSHRHGLIDEARRLLPVTAEVATGSVGLKMGLVARGRCDLYLALDDRTHSWDSCGPQAVLEAAGGTVTDVFGEPLVYDSADVTNRRGIVAAAAHRHRRIVEALRPLTERHFVLKAPEKEPPRAP